MSGARISASYAPDRTPDRHSWMDGAPCQQVDPEDFYPEKGGSPAAAKKVCAGCGVKDVCLAWALERNERYGVWGGLSERERRRLQGRNVSSRPTVHASTRSGTYSCPESGCGRVFLSANALGGHRGAAHGYRVRGAA